jgi:hypothetical protein
MLLLGRLLLWRLLLLRQLLLLLWCWSMLLLLAAEVAIHRLWLLMLG